MVKSDKEKESKSYYHDMNKALCSVCRKPIYFITKSVNQWVYRVKIGSRMFTQCSYSHWRQECKRRDEYEAGIQKNNTIGC